MTMLSETTVRTEPVILIWDAASKCDTDDKTGKITWGVTVAIRKDSTTYAEMKAAADKEISKVYPTGAPHGFKTWAKDDFDPTKYAETPPDQYVHVRFGSKDFKPTFNGTQQVGKEEFGRLAYAGALVSVIGRCWCYTKSEQTKNQTGLKWFFEGVQLVDGNAPRLSVAAGMSQSAVASAFGATQSVESAFSAPAAATPTVAAPVTPPTPVTPPAPNPGIVPPVPTPKLTATGHTVDSMQAAGWTLEQLKAEGYVM
jgi:hypothetical protein